jgi:hypothetical protein
MSKFNIATEYDRAFYYGHRRPEPIKTEQKDPFFGFRKRRRRISGLCGRKAEASESQRLCPVKVVTEYAF